MNGPKSLTIADLQMDLHFLFPVEHDYPPHYQPFLDVPGDIHVPATFTTAPLPGFSLDEASVSADLDAWQFFREPGKRVFVHRGSHGRPPHWIASLPDDQLSIDVQCTEALDRNGKTWNPLQFPMDQILWINLLCRFQGFLLHGAGLEYKGKAWLFCGRSGAGKSTLSRQFLDARIGNLLSDDRIIVRRSDEDFTAWGTPWVGDAGIAENLGVPLEGICFIQQGSENRLSPLSGLEALERIMLVVSNPVYDRQLTEAVLDELSRLADRVPIYDYECRADPSAARDFEHVLTAL